MKTFNIIVLTLAVLWTLTLFRGEMANSQQQVHGLNFNPTMSGSTSSPIGGSALLINQSSTGTATITGAVAGQPCIAVPSDGTDMLGSSVQVSCTVTAANTATVRVYALIAATPVSKTYSVRILP